MSIISPVKQHNPPSHPSVGRTPLVLLSDVGHIGKYHRERDREDSRYGNHGKVPPTEIILRFIREVAYIHFHNQNQRCQVKAINQNINCKNVCIFKHIKDNQ